MCKKARAVREDSSCLLYNCKCCLLYGRIVKLYVHVVIVKTGVALEAFYLLNAGWIAISHQSTCDTIVETYDSQA